jgi:hypothetical protein
MNRAFRIVIVTFIILILYFPGVLGHVPVDSEDNTSLERALEIKEPQKSWAIYDELHEEGEGKYYRVHLKNGDRLFVSLLTPDEGKFAPDLLIMGPALGSNDSIPDFLEIAENTDKIHLEGTKEEAEYEPFTPASNYPLAEFDEKVNESGIYYIVVFSEDSHGRFILAVGYQESFTIVEWLKVPLDLINIYLWSGHSPLIIIIPFLLWLVVGVYILLTRIGPDSLNTWLLLVGAMLYLGSATLTTIEMGIAIGRSGFSAAAIVTLIFILIPVVLGLIIFMRINKKEKLEKNKRIPYFLYGILGLFFWCGVIVGPVLVILASVLPVWKPKKEEENGEKEGQNLEKEEGSEMENGKPDKEDGKPKPEE